MPIGQIEITIAALVALSVVILNLFKSYKIWRDLNEKGEHENSNCDTIDGD